MLFPGKGGLPGQIGRQYTLVVVAPEKKSPSYRSSRATLAARHTFSVNIALFLVPAITAAREQRLFSPEKDKDPQVFLLSENLSSGNALRRITGPADCHL
jgi:hypothetical protein